MKTTTSILAFLVTACASAAATPTAPTPPPPPPPPTGGPSGHGITCNASGGDLLIEIDHDAIPNTKNPTSDIKLAVTGGWTFTSKTDEGKDGRTATGCLGKEDLAKVKAAIDGAPWKVTHPKIQCRAMAQTFVVTTIGTKLTVTQKMCGNDILDEKSVAALVDIGKILDAASAPHDPPCCKK